MSYTADKEITRDAALDMLQKCKYGQINMEYIRRIAEQATEFDMQVSEKRIGMRNDSGLDCVMSLATVDDTDFFTNPAKEESKITAERANELLGMFYSMSNNHQLCWRCDIDLSICMLKGDFGFGNILLSFHKKIS